MGTVSPVTDVVILIPIDFVFLTDWLFFFLARLKTRYMYISECSLRGRVGLVRLSLCESGSHNHDVPRARNGLIVDGMCHVRRGMYVHRPCVMYEGLVAMG